MMEGPGRTERKWLETIKGGGGGATEYVWADWDGMRRHVESDGGTGQNKEALLV